MPTDRPAPWLPLSGVTGQLSTDLIFAILPAGMMTISSPAAEAAGFDAARDDAAVVEFVDRLHRQPQRERFQRAGRLERVERLDDGWPLVPADPRRVLGNAVAVARGNRNHRRWLHAEADQMRGYLVADFLEPARR